MRSKNTPCGISAHVRYYPKSGHSLAPPQCPLCANQRHRAINPKDEKKDRLAAILNGLR